MEEKKQVGRPTAYDPIYCEQLISHMEQGLSYEAFAGFLGVSKQTLYDWEKANPAFLDAKEIGIQKSRMFWEKLGIDHILNVSENYGKDAGSKSKSLNAAVWCFNMKNRFRWTDRQEISGDPEKPGVKLTLNYERNKAKKEIE